MAKKKRAKRETIRGAGNDPFILDPMRWGEIGLAGDVDERSEPEPPKRELKPDRPQHKPRRTRG